MSAMAPTWEIGNDVQYFLTPMTKDATTGVWSAINATYPLQKRVNDVSFTLQLDNQSISPTHFFNKNPVIFEQGVNVEIDEDRFASAEVSNGNTGLSKGNVLSACSKASFTHKMEIKFFDKAGAEITGSRVNLLLQIDTFGFNASKPGNKNTMSLSTIAIADSSTGVEISNPFFGSTSVPF